MNCVCGCKSAIRLGLASLLAAGCLVTGCGKEEKAAPTATAEVRGEPIQGEPIAQAPANPKPAEPGPAAVPGTRDSVTASTPAVAAPPATPASPAVDRVATALGQTPEAAPVAKASDPGASGVGTPESPLVVGFDKLASFKYDLPDGQVDTNTVAQTGAANQIPAPIKALNNQFISLKGFMLPLKVEKGLVTELLMMRDQSMCCYGTVPRINEWVSVKMVGTGVKPIMDQAVTLFGKLKVGEMYENGYLVGIYSLDGERMAGPLDM
ncbi:MAG: hypothetical protein JNK85_25640 [Verrucomicrobiales bacterium]|nr:hypothetical protein [Verrucomicrobiales bacterium]